MKLLILGHARHGKDTLAEIFRDRYGLTFTSSSMAAAEIFIYDELKGKYGYSSFKECFSDRVNRRSEWHDLICGYNKFDKSRLAKAILKTSDCYVGMRSYDEVMACRVSGLFDLIVWVDASERLPLEDKSSFNIDKRVADIIIENNQDLEEFKYKAYRIGKTLFK